MIILKVLRENKFWRDFSGDIFWNFTTLYQSDLPQVKRDFISSITNFINEWPHEIQLKILENSNIWVDT